MYTPLMVAVLNSRDAQQSIVEALVTANADLNAVNKDGSTALMLALLNCDDNEMHVPAAVQIALIEAGKIRYSSPCAMW